MIGERVALLFGLFIAPLILLYLGQRLRERSERARRRFWGGVIGHVAGMLVATVAMLAPPIWWAGGSFARDFAVHWSMLIGFALGLLIGPRKISSRGAAHE
jgi:hypothetical protein